jgi:hypothetical protein
VMSAMSLDEFKKSGVMRTMTPEDCIAYIKGRQQEAPIEAFCMQVPSGFPLDRMAEYAETFASKVIPAFR